MVAEGGVGTGERKPIAARRMHRSISRTAAPVAIAGKASVVRVKIAASAVESGPPDRLTIGFSEITYRIPRPGSCSAPHLIACHADSYTGRHGGTNTPETCLQCHTGPTWTAGDFDHPSVANGFELLGAHSLTSCAACHEADGSPRYPGVADDQCIACHQDDYDGRHGGSNTPTTCLTCHTRDSFSGADFDHDAAYFPISSGKHQGKWSGCATCHVDPSDYTDFSCFACHVHDQNRMDDKHSERAGYAYDSDLCYACHPRGKAE